MISALKSTFIFFFVFFSLFSPTLAQGIPGIQEPITFQISPEFPKPGTIVNVWAQSYSTDLNRALFSWYVNGKLFAEGTGLTDISIPAGRTGSATEVSVDISTIDLGPFHVESSFTPAEVTLLWQTDGYVPPFYEGKALELYGSSFKVTAIPEFYTSAGKRIDPSTLVYSWKKNGTVEPSESGYGKSTFVSSQSSYVRGGDDISVEVSTIARDIGATESVTLSPMNAEILFYENSPLYGIIYERALFDTFELSDEELTLRAEPFNMSVSRPLSGALSLEWTLNSSPLPLFKNKNEITLRKTTEDTGQSDLGLSIQHSERILQGGQAAITILQ